MNREKTGNKSADFADGRRFNPLEFDGFRIRSMEDGKK